MPLMQGVPPAPAGGRLRRDEQGWLVKTQAGGARGARVAEQAAMQGAQTATPQSPGETRQALTARAAAGVLPRGAAAAAWDDGAGGAWRRGIGAGGLASRGPAGTATLILPNRGRVNTQRRAGGGAHSRSARRGRTPGCRSRSTSGRTQTGCCCSTCCCCRCRTGRGRSTAGRRSCRRSYRRARGERGERRGSAAIVSEGCPSVTPCLCRPWPRAWRASNSRPLWLARPAAATHQRPPTHATPGGQNSLPQGVVPATAHAPLRQPWPAGQHVEPHTCAVGQHLGAGGDKRQAQGAASAARVGAQTAGLPAATLCAARAPPLPLTCRRRSAGPWGSTA
jgi:hypothetical protein